MVNYVFSNRYVDPVTPLILPSRVCRVHLVALVTTHVRLVFAMCHHATRIPRVVSVASLVTFALVREHIGFSLTRTRGRGEHTHTLLFFK